MALAAGDRLGPYEILIRIGAGGMGEVYRALDTKLNRPVAVKVLSDELADAGVRRRFQREAQMASSLNHPHILTVYDAGEFEGRQYLVTEYIGGGTLKHWAKSQKHTWREIVELMVGVADGLATAHEAKILHRDIKPANILVTESGYAKLVDFGLAKSVETPSQSDATKTLTEHGTKPGMVIGTIAYMSPEQSSGQMLDVRTDVFSFGVVMYELLAGRRPFAGSTDLETLQKIIHETPARLGEQVPLPLRLIVEKALAKVPEERYQSMREMVVDLRRLLQSTGELAAAPGRRRSARWAAAIIMAAGVAGWWGHNLASRGTEPQIRSLAVLPLRNLSGNADQYFADGMTEALTTGLAQISALSVISRTSVLRYQATRKTAPEIARELHVDGLVEGSVHRSGDRVQITVQLIAAAGDRHLWARSYERDTKDALALQSEVAQAIAAEIRVKLTQQEQTRFGSPRSVNLEAQEAYLRGLYWKDKNDPRKFHEYMLQAIHKDPGYALAYASLGDSYGVLSYSGMIPAAEAFPKWRESVDKALSLDDNLPEAHKSLAALLFFRDYKWQDGEREFRRALQLNPNLVDAHLWLADDFAVTGRTEEAVAEARRGLQLSPNSVQSNYRLGLYLVFAKRLDQAVEHGQRMLEQDPAWAHWILGLAYEQKGNLERAIREYQEALTLSGSTPDLKTTVSADLAHAYATSGNKKEALRLLVEIRDLSKLIRVDPGNFAILYTGLGEKDQAFEWLDRGYTDRPSTVMRAKVEPRLEPLHSDARFKGFLRKMGLLE